MSKRRERRLKTWWDKIEDPGKPEWEILPHEAKNGEVILSKRNELGLLSNLAATPFTLDGIDYASVEALWQECKLPDPELPGDPRTSLSFPCDRATMRGLHGLESKRLGDRCSLVMKENGIAWISHRGERWVYPENERGAFYRLIRRAMEAKLAQNPAVRDILRETGNLILKPDHHVVGPLSPAHRYDEIWMELRSNLTPASPSPERSSAGRK